MDYDPTIEAVRYLTSDLAIEPATARQKVGTGTGWRAKPLTSLSQREISVRLPTSVYSQLQQARDPEGQNYLRFYTSDDA